MPIYEYTCSDCGKTIEVLVMGAGDAPECSACAGKNLQRRLSVPAAYSGQSSDRIPGPGDTACCGGTPGHSACAGPGSCCGKG